MMRDIKNAECDRGIANLKIIRANDVAPDFIFIKLAGGEGKDKTFTVTEGSQTFTQTFTVSEWEDAKSLGNVLRFSERFNGGTRISFDVDFDAIENVPDTAGVGASVIDLWFLEDGDA